MCIWLYLYTYARTRGHVSPLGTFGYSLRTFPSLSHSHTLSPLSPPPHTVSHTSLSLSLSLSHTHKSHTRTHTNTHTNTQHTHIHTNTRPRTHTRTHAHAHTHTHTHTNSGQDRQRGLSELKHVSNLQQLPLPLRPVQLSRTSRTLNGFTQP